MTTFESLSSLLIREGFTVLLDERQLERHQCLTVAVGLLRVAASRFEEDALEAHVVTLGFLQTGDQLPLDLLRKKRLHLRALTDTRLVECCPTLPAADGNSLYDWTLEMLLIRHHNEAEQRISALIQLLVRRLGHRRGAWYELRLPMTQAELADLCGLTRVTLSRQFSRWRLRGLLEQDCGLLRLAPALVET
jgi:CRP-like cAMP-binding protein